MKNKTSAVIWVFLNNFLTPPQLHHVHVLGCVHNLMSYPDALIKSRNDDKVSHELYR